MRVQLTGRAADGSGVRLGDKGEVNGVAVNLRGLADKRGEIGHGGNGGGTGGVVADLIDGAVLDSGAVNGDGGVVDGRDRAFNAEAAAEAAVTTLFSTVRS